MKRKSNEESDKRGRKKNNKIKQKYKVINILNLFPGNGAKNLTHSQSGTFTPKYKSVEVIKITR